MSPNRGAEDSTFSLDYPSNTPTQPQTIFNLIQELHLHAFYITLANV